MSRLTHKSRLRMARKNRVSSSIESSAERPRLSVQISKKHVRAQIIDDINNKTLVSSSTIGKKNLPTNLTERSISIGQDIAIQAKKAKIKKIVFDRGSKAYHGRVKALAEAARKSGLEF